MSTTALHAVTLGVLLASLLSAGDLKFSDPANQPPAPPAAAGYPSRDANLDALPGFRNPPPGYGEVPFYWWQGAPLTRERLRWQLDQLKDKRISGLQINYAHSDKGGKVVGLTYPSDPPLFSESWWKLFGWFLGEARKDGAAVSLSDYTLGWPGQGYYTDEILKDAPEIHGAALEHEARECPSGSECIWRFGSAPLAVTAVRTDGATHIDLRGRVQDGELRWTPPVGHWRVVIVRAVPKPVSIDPMHPASGRQMIAKFYQRFEDRNPGEGGKGLNFFFSDELSFGVRGWLWNGWFAGEFRKRKGYDVVPELAALFVDMGPRTAKVRLDYSDVMVSLEEENFFRPLYEWHRSRGMMFGCDHGGRGLDVTEFGDYFRTQRWMLAPGNDQPRLTSNVIKNKVAASIAHLYERPRTWLEGYHSSGWSTSSADVVDATWR
ncbi:MAG: glycosyl hydrolase, partial [Bryobacteraceae bacterium]